LFFYSVVGVKDIRIETERPKAKEGRRKKRGNNKKVESWSGGQKKRP
jgi:hypothetical protein